MKPMNIINPTELPDWFVTELARASEDLTRSDHWKGLGEIVTAEALQRTANQRAGIAGIRLGSGDPVLLGKALLGRHSSRSGGGRAS